jgi:hypothetical protein
LNKHKKLVIVGNGPGGFVNRLSPEENHSQKELQNLRKAAFANDKVSPVPPQTKNVPCGPVIPDLASSGRNYLDITK